jgi:hypothetical protein
MLQKEKPKGEPFQQIDTEIVALSLQVDSFFDVFFDVAADGTRNTSDDVLEIFGDPDFLFGDPDFAIDSFFDVFTELDARDRHFDTEIVSMQLSGGSPLTVSNIGSSGEDGVQIALPKGSLQSQIDRLELRIAELEGGDSKTCEECKLDLREALSACSEGDDACVIAANNNYRECLSDLSPEELNLCTKVLPPTRK